MKNLFKKWRSDESGATLVEIVVASVLFITIAAFTVNAVLSNNETTNEGVALSFAQDNVNISSVKISRIINSAEAVIGAEDERVTLRVFDRATEGYKTVTIFYDEITDTLKISDNGVTTEELSFVEPAIFTYYSGTSLITPTAANAASITRIDFKLSVSVDGRILPVTSEGTAFLRQTVY